MFGIEWMFRKQPQSSMWNPMSLFAVFLRHLFLSSCKSLTYCVFLLVRICSKKWLSSLARGEKKKTYHAIFLFFSKHSKAFLNLIVFLSSFSSIHVTIILTVVLILFKYLGCFFKLHYVKSTFSYYQSLIFKWFTVIISQWNIQFLIFHNHK